MHLQRVAITGVGVLGPKSIGLESFRQLLDSGVTAVETITRFDTEGLRAHSAALLNDFRPKEFISPMKMRRMNMLSRIGVAAAKLTLDDAKYDSARYARPDVGVALGTCFGPVQTSLEYMDEYVAKGPALAPPQLFAESVANAPGSHVAIEHGFEGFNITFTQRESSAMAALLHAATQVSRGSVRAALAGGIEEINELIFSVLDRAGALARATDSLSEAARPFDRNRNGVAAGEGGGMFLLEGDPTGEPYAYVSGFGVARDATATISDWGHDPRPVERAMQKALTDAELSAADVGAVFASANGNRLGDRTEAEAIQNLFAGGIPPVVATKGIFGEYAAAGALQIATAVVAIRDQRLPSSVGFDDGEEGIRFEPTRAATERQLEHVLVNSTSAGGGIICAVLSRRSV